MADVALRVCQQGGGLGGFLLHIAFGVMNDLIGLWTSCFMLLHFSSRHVERRRFSEVVGETDLPQIMEAAASLRGS